MDPASGASCHRGYLLVLHHASRARAGPTRRIAISGTSTTVTSPTSHGQRSVGIRERRRFSVKASLASLKRPTAGQLADLPQEALVHAQLAILLRVGHHGADDLRAEALLLPAGRQAGQVHALSRAAKVPAVAAGADLLEVDHRCRLSGFTTPTWESRKLMNSPLGSIAST